MNTTQTPETDTEVRLHGHDGWINPEFAGDIEKQRSQLADANEHAAIRACAGIDNPEEAIAKAREALASLLRETNNIEVLGEWSGLEINHGLQNKVRAKVDSVIQQARKALATITPKI